MTILIATATGPGGLSPEAIADDVVRGVLRAAPGAIAVRAPSAGGMPELGRFDLVLAVGASVRIHAILARAAEAGVAAVVLGGALRARGAERYPAGLVAYEPEPHPGAIDVAMDAQKLRQGALAAVQMLLGCRAAA